MRLVECLEDCDVIEGDSATFAVKLSHAGIWDSVWWLGETKLQNNKFNDIGGQSSQTQTLALHKLELEDSNTVRFCSGNISSSAVLTVKRKTNPPAGLSGCKSRSPSSLIPYTYKLM